MSTVARCGEPSPHGHIRCPTALSRAMRDQNSAASGRHMRSGFVRAEAIVEDERMPAAHAGTHVG